MSPILKRDVAETVRQARRFAAATGLVNYNDYGEYELDPVRESKKETAAARRESGDWADVNPDSGGRAGSSAAASARNTTNTSNRGGSPSYFDIDRGDRDRDEDPLLDRGGSSDAASVTTTMSAMEGKWSDARRLLFSVSCCFIVPACVEVARTSSTANKISTSSWIPAVCMHTEPF
jgi:hypothetical protein